MVETFVDAQYITGDGTVDTFKDVQISDMGNIRSIHNGTLGAPITVYNQKTTGYKYVSLFARGSYHNYYIHRMMLSSFKPKSYFAKAVAAHLDDDPSHNVLTNLDWWSNQQNTSTPYKNMKSRVKQLNHPTKSKRVRMTDLNTGETIEFPSAKEAGRLLGLDNHIVAVCINMMNGIMKKRHLKFEYV